MEALTLAASGMTFDAVAAGPADGRPVLLLHGFPQGAREWAAVMTPLAQAGHRVVAPDQRGYSPGARPAGVDAYRMAALVADTIGFADALGVERVDLVGHDWGAAVAWQAAARHPDRIRSLTAVSVPHPVAFSEALRHDADQRERSRYMVYFRLEGGVAERGLAEDGFRRLRAMYGGHVAADDADRYVAALSEPGALTAALNWYRAMEAADMDGLEPIRVPTLHVWSTGDDALGRVATEASGAHVAAPYRLEVLDGVSHWIPDEAPERLAGLVLEHLTAT